jgi:UPF0755 protein
MAKLKTKVKAVLCAAVLAGGWFTKTRFDPMPTGEKIKVTFSTSTSFNQAVQTLKEKGIIKDANAAKFLGLVNGSRSSVKEGTYEFQPGMSLGDALSTLKKPSLRMVRIPEGRWIARVAKQLEEKGVVKADDYIAATKDISQYAQMGVPIEGESLEGFLYPDTYNVPPGSDATFLVRRQLLNFAQRTSKLRLTKENVHRTLTIASMLELEAASTSERKMISGVIKNRLSKGMKLQVDATVNYGMQLWRPLFYKDYTSVKSPYNTYLYKGLPPGPICSPSKSSIEAALEPSKHSYLFYITMPDGVTLFSATYAEHLKNVAKRDQIKKATGVKK